MLVLGAIAIFLCGQILVGVAALDRRLARRFFGPSGQKLVRRRVFELATTRSEVVEAVNEERRRIERGLHDGSDGRGGRVTPTERLSWSASGGLSGLARRMAAMDGKFSLQSPENRPTVVRVTLRCE